MSEPAMDQKNGGFEPLRAHYRWRGCISGENRGAALLLWAAPFINVASWGASEAVTANLLRPRQLYLAVAVSEDPTCGESLIE